MKLSGFTAACRSYASVLALTIAGMAPMAAHADLVFYATQAERNSDTAVLWIYNTETDMHTMVGETNMPVHGLDFDSAGTLYGFSGRRGSALENRFYSLDLATGNATEIGTMPICCQSDMSFDETGTTLYIINRDGFLRTVDTADGSLTDIGDGNARRGMAIDSGGTAYQVDSNTLYTVDLGTGATAAVGAITGLTYNTVLGLDFAPDDTLYGIDYARCCSFESNLVTIDVGTQAATLVTELPTNSVGLAVVADTDTDSDGIPDIFEIAFGRDPNDASDAGEDGDGDGLTFLEEYQLGTSDNNVDSDGDGVEDGEEVDLGLDPTHVDTDRDRVQDGTELLAGLDPLVANNGRITLSGGSDPRHVNILQDDAGNYHFVWDADDGTGEWRVYYGLTDADGEILIDGTVISDSNGSNDSQPQFAIGSDGKVRVIWHDTNRSTFFALVDPAADTQDGDAADPVDIVEVAETEILADYRHGKIALDADDNAFVVMEDGDVDLAFVKVDSSGAVVDGPTSFITSPGNNAGYKALPGIAADSDGNMHFAWSFGDRLYYAMLQSSDSSFLIAPTVIATATVGSNGAFNSGAKFATPVFDADGLLHVVFGDKKGQTDGTGGGIFYVTVDPSLAVQDGSADDSIVVRTKTRITDLLLDAGEPWYPHAGFDSAGALSVVWNGDGGGDEGTSNVIGVSVNAASGATGSQALLSDNLTHRQTGDESRVATPHVAGNRAAFSEDNVVVSVLFGGGAAGASSFKSNFGSVTLARALTEADLPAAARDSLPAGVTFANGFNQVVITDLEPGETITLTVVLPADRPDGAVVYKYTPADGWFVLPHVDGFAANEIQVQLTDGGATDADGEVNGIILDPIGVGSDPNLAGTPISTSGSGGGCTIGDSRQPFDPIFPMLLLLAGIYLFRRRQAN